ncbi:DUF3231 family protein [Bacillus alkalicellulosilyticus]|uniref:DUF3231 family protein n=1 Tax=Alkalihalobacterium alkalicellulosilyticum TaxID=1912214 RepID=UPI001FE63BF3|nr:DUF3231 family protein [Bacillus alkalicellulosilyticus]
MNDSMAICVLTHFLQHVKDPDINKVIQYGLQLSEQHISFITTLYKEENIAIPKGFTLQDDVDLSAPQLYSDSFCLLYIHNMAKIGGNGYILSLSNAAREDIRNFFTECTAKSAELFNRSAQILLAKGLFLRPPQIDLPGNIDFVKEESFLAGWLGEHRPLNSIEIMNLYFNIERNQLGKSLVMGFSQIAKSKQVTKYFKRGKEIAAKQIEVFGSILSQSELPAPMTWDTLPTKSTTYTFSEKLMVFHVAALSGASVSHYGTSMGTSPRRDIGLHYTRLLAEIMLFAEDGAKIMIEHGMDGGTSKSSRQKSISYPKIEKVFR